MEEDRISNKITEIEKFWEELNEALPKDFAEYERDFRVKAICERYFEKIVEAGVDLAYFFIREKKWKFPETEKELFNTLSEQGVISERLALRLKDAKGMRNILAHQYGEVNDKAVFTAVTEELGPDVLEFLEGVRTDLQKNKPEKH